MIDWSFDSDDWISALQWTMQVLAAVSELAIPHFVSAAINTLRAGDEMAAFWKNLKILTVCLCFDT
jgi:hypothetical protein